MRGDDGLPKWIVDELVAWLEETDTGRLTLHKSKDGIKLEATKFVKEPEPLHVRNYSF